MEQTKLPEDETRDQMEDITEEKFLKDLYIFMKKRDTPIERIPNLGFKQSMIFIFFYFGEHLCFNIHILLLLLLKPKGVKQILLFIIYAVFNRAMVTR